MADSAQVLAMLIPQGGYIQVGQEYEGIQFLECEPITKEQFEAGFAQYDAWKAEQETKAIQAKNAAIAKLTALGLTEEDIAALLA